MFKGVKRVLCGGIDKRCSYAFLLILCGFLLSTKMTTPETMGGKVRAIVLSTRRNCFKSMPEKIASKICSILWMTVIPVQLSIDQVFAGWSR